MIYTTLEQHIKAKPRSLAGIVADVRPLGWLFRAVSFVGILALASLPALAVTLDLTIDKPDLSAGFLTASFDATTRVFSADGWPISFDLNGNSSMIDGGQYTLTTQLGLGDQAVSGNLDITGTIPGLATSGMLLTGTLAQFGFMPVGGDIFEFVFDPTGGDLARYYPSGTDVVLDAVNSEFDGSFANSFSSSPVLSIADNGSVVPEPSSAALLLIAAVLGASCTFFLPRRTLASR